MTDHGATAGIDVMFGLGVPELILILIVVLLIFGPRKLPELGGFVGKALRDFRDALERRGNDDAEPPAPLDPESGRASHAARPTPSGKDEPGSST